MNKYFSEIYKKILKNLNFTVDNVKTRRLRFLKTASVLGFIFLFIFGMINIIFLRRYDNGIIEIVLAVYFFVNIYSLKYTKNDELAISVGLLTLFALFIFLLISGGIAFTGIYWLFIFPGIVFFLKGIKKGLKWIIYLYIFLFLLVSLQKADVLILAFPAKTIVMAMSVLILISIFQYIYEFVNGYSAQRAMEKNENLLVANTNLKKEIKAREKAEKLLQNKFKDLEKMNRLMIGRELRIAELKKEIRELKGYKK